MWTLPIKLYLLNTVSVSTLFPFYPQPCGKAKNILWISSLWKHWKEDEMVQGSCKSMQEPLASSAIGFFWQIIVAVCVSIFHLQSRSNNPCHLSPILQFLSNHNPLWERNCYLQHVCIVAKTTGFGFVLGLFNNTVPYFNKFVAYYRGWIAYPSPQQMKITSIQVHLHFRIQLMTEGCVCV